jgi:hypothetical protein
MALLCEKSKGVIPTKIKTIQGEGAFNPEF